MSLSKLSAAVFKPARLWTTFARSYCDKKGADKALDKFKKLSKEEKPSGTGVIDLSINEDDEPQLREREADAIVHGKMSKECDVLTQRKVPLGSSSSINVCLDIHKDKIPPPPLPDFEKTYKKPKLPMFPPFKEPPIPIPIKEEPPTTVPTRLVRLEPGKVELGFLPREWMDFFIPKTGVTGFYTFMLTVGTFLVSKEYYVLEHNFYNGLSMFVCVWAAIRYLGPQTAKYLDKEVAAYESKWQKCRDGEVDMIKKDIENELYSQYLFEGQVLLIDAKRENAALQLEEEFRRRQMYVYEEVKQRMDYHLAVDRVNRRYQHLNLIDYVYREVQKSITPEMQDKLINYSIERFMDELSRPIQDK